jgi:hypothetical protein
MPLAILFLFRRDTDPGASERGLLNFPQSGGLALHCPICCIRSGVRRLECAQAHSFETPAHSFILWRRSRRAYNSAA